MSFQSHVKILILGAEGVGKHRLAKAIVDHTHNGIDIKIHTSSELTDRSLVKWPQHDFIIFLADMTICRSFTVMKSMLRCTDMNYFLGHSCIVALQVKEADSYSFGLDAISEMANQLLIPLYTGSINDENELKCLASSLWQRIGISVGLKSVSSAFVHAGTSHALQHQL